MASHLERKKASFGTQAKMTSVCVVQNSALGTMMGFYSLKAYGIGDMHLLVFYISTELFLFFFFQYYKITSLMSIFAYSPVLKHTSFCVMLMLANIWSDIKYFLLYFLEKVSVLQLIKGNTILEISYFSSKHIINEVRITGVPHPASQDMLWTNSLIFSSKLYPCE